MSYNADRDAQKIQEEVRQLQLNYEQAQEDIIDKIRKNKRDFDQRVCTLKFQNVIPHMYSKMFLNAKYCLLMWGWSKMAVHGSI